MTAYRAAIDALKRCHDGLSRYPSPDERARLLRLHAEALAILEAGHDRRRLRTAALADRVRTLDRKLADLSPGERRRAVCQRLGIGRSWYYELRRESG